MDEDAILRSVLESGGYTNAERLDPREVFDSNEQLLDVGWRPDHLYRANNHLWAVDRLIGEDLPEFIIESMIARMTEARGRCPQLIPCFLVSPDSEYGDILDNCAAEDVAVIALVGNRFDFIPLCDLPSPQAVAAPAYHLPLRLVERVMQLENVDKRFAASLKDFGVEYVELAKSGRFAQVEDSLEEELLRRHFRGVLAVDDRFTVPFELLEVLKRFETEFAPRRARDHFFHAFHTFLLGCLVLDQAYPHFTEFATRVMGQDYLSIEFTWLLTALFHDIGYPLELGCRLQRQQLGASREEAGGPSSDASNGDRVVRTQFWASGEWTVARLRLVDLWEYLHAEKPGGPWLAQSVDIERMPDHPLDRALLDGLLRERCHGVVSCMRLVTELQRRVRQRAAKDERDLLLQHVFIAGLSIPFHHSAFRQVLIGYDILQLRTDIFPFAALLAFVDSIQDDRRALELHVSGPDILHDLVVESGVVRPVIQLAPLTEDQVEQVALKRREALEVQQFLHSNGLAYEYPPEFLGAATQ